MTAVVENTQVVTIDKNTIQVVTVGTQGAAGVGVPSGGTAGQVLAKIDAEDYNTHWIPAAGTGTVTSVAMTVPTGLSVSGSPITGAGTLAVTLAGGYVIPTQATLDGKQGTITLTTTGTSGAATFDGATLNIPQYSSGGGSIAWGAITGTLSNQTDLQNALNAKQNTITTGSTAQYLRGDLSLATFPTAVSSFANDAGYITTSALTPYALLSGATFSGAISATNLSGTNTGDQNLAPYLLSATAASTYVPLTRTVNGQALSGDITLTTANIADSSNKRYVTDLQLVVIGNTSGTNTGDQTNITGNAGTVTTINGHITAGTNVTITGSGTTASPYEISSSGGGGGGAPAGAEYVVLSANGSLTHERVLTAGTGISLTDAGAGSTITVASTITQYTDEMAQDAVGGILVDSSEIDFTYNDGTPSITASLKTGIDAAKLADGSVSNTELQYINSLSSNAQTQLNAAKTKSVTFTFDGMGSTLTVGKIIYFYGTPFTGTITSATLGANTSGSLVIDVYKASYASAPPTSGNKITASAPPTLSSAQKSTDSTLTGWTTSVTAGDVWAAEIISVSGISFATLSLGVSLP